MTTNCELCQEPILKNAYKTDQDLVVGFAKNGKGEPIEHKAIQVRIQINPYTTQSPNMICRSCRSKVFDLLQARLKENLKAEDDVK